MHKRRISETTRHKVKPIIVCERACVLCLNQIESLFSAVPGTQSHFTEKSKEKRFYFSAVIHLERVLLLRRDKRKQRYDDDRREITWLDERKEIVSIRRFSSPQRIASQALVDDELNSSSSLIRCRCHHREKRLSSPFLIKIYRLNL